MEERLGSKPSLEVIKWKTLTKRTKSNIKGLHQMKGVKLNKEEGANLVGIKDIVRALPL